VGGTVAKVEQDVRTGAGLPFLVMTILYVRPAGGAIDAVAAAQLQVPPLPQLNKDLQNSNYQSVGP
jgi:hypothetical protein